MLHRLFKPRRAQLTGQALYAACVEQARQPRLYAQLGCPDTPEGRFEIYTLHMILLVSRLQTAGPEAADVAQALFDTYVKALDHGLRELGVGDTSVGKKMRRLGEAIYGRARSYQSAFAALPDRSSLEALLARTVYEGADPSLAPGLAGYVVGQRVQLDAEPLEQLLQGRVTWRAL